MRIIRLVVAQLRFRRAKIKVRRLSVYRIVVDMPTSVSLFVNSALCVFLEKLFEVFVNDKIGQMPVVESRSFQRLVAYIETDGFYQMHLATRCRRRTHDVARVLRYFGFYQNNVERHIPLPFYATMIALFSFFFKRIHA